MMLAKRVIANPTQGDSNRIPLVLCLFVVTLPAFTGCAGGPLGTQSGGGGANAEEAGASLDSDKDTVADASDNCPDVPNADQADTDADGVGDVCDGCFQDGDKTAPGVCGCGVPETEEDADRDGVVDCIDNCADDPGKSEPGVCGCGVADADTDADGVLDCLDECPGDPGKTAPGVCGCGVADDDTDDDGLLDCNDGCPGDPDKIEPGDCGCGVADDDSDSDGVLDCNDDCPDDPEKTGPGACGCGVADDDTDGDGMIDCLSDAVVPGVGHDGVTLGKTPEQIIAILGEPDLEEDGENLWLNWRESQGIDVLFTGTPRLAREIRYNEGTDLELNVGPGIGTPRNEVFAIFGDPIEVRPAESNERLFDDRVLYELTNGASKIIYSDQGVLFWFDDQDATSQFVVFPAGP